MSTFVGLTAGILCVVLSIAQSGDFATFFNLPSVFITVGGTLASCIVAFPPNRLKSLGPVMRRAFKTEGSDIAADIETIVALATVARKEGLLALQDAVDQYTNDDFLKRGIGLMADGANTEELRYSLEGETYFMQQRHQKGSAMLDMIAATAPALGLMGTYIGLIPMLTNLEDPSTLGPLMALELVTSFYGAFLAYVIFSPMSKRLKNMNGEEATRREILIEGLVCIQQGKNPRTIEDDLVRFANLKRDGKKSTQKGSQSANQRGNQKGSQAGSQKGRSIGRRENDMPA